LQVAISEAIRSDAAHCAASVSAIASDHPDRTIRVTGGAGTRRCEESQRGTRQRLSPRYLKHGLLIHHC
jgi:hypothetical protein